VPRLVQSDRREQLDTRRVLRLLDAPVGCQNSIGLWNAAVFRSPAVDRCLLCWGPVDCTQASVSSGFSRLGHSLPAPRGLLPGERNVSHSFVVHSQRERIRDAVANLTTESGYAGLTSQNIVDEAAVSLQSFYTHFTDKEDAFLVAYEIGHRKALASAERAYAAEPDWRSGVRAAIAALFDFLVSERSFAHLAFVDALTATPSTADRSNMGMLAYGQLLVPGYEEAPKAQRPPAVTIEAIAGGMVELCLSHALQESIGELPGLVPSATYFALAPFIGAEEAARVATEPATG
jgi:AcrR family transcriptional regulator